MDRLGQGVFLLPFGVLLHLTLRLLLFKPAIQRRDEQQRQERGGDQSSYDHGRKALLYFTLQF